MGINTSMACMSEFQTIMNTIKNYNSDLDILNPRQLNNVLMTCLEEINSINGTRRNLKGLPKEETFGVLKELKKEEAGWNGLAKRTKKKLNNMK